MKDTNKELILTRREVQALNNRIYDIEAQKKEEMDDQKKEHEFVIA
jgi:BMFP domain-containing protein YqiC